MQRPHVHQRDDGNEDGGDRPSKHQRILRFCEHEDDNHFIFFENEELDELERYDYGLDNEDDDGETETDFTASKDDVLNCFEFHFGTQLEC